MPAKAVGSTAAGLRWRRHPERLAPAPGVTSVPAVGFEPTLSTS